MSPHRILIQWLKWLVLHPHWIVFFIANRLSLIVERWLESCAVQVELSVLILVLHLVLHSRILNLLEWVLVVVNLLGSLSLISLVEVLEMLL